MDNLLIIFARPPVLGKVKTRLAATLGGEKTLKIYEFLLAKTLSEADKVANADKLIFSSEKSDFWQNHQFNYSTQTGADLGEKMQNAFAWAFAANYKQVIIIGADCYELNANILTLGFETLRKQAAVIGQAKDGGYYLLGIKQLHIDLFVAKKWSTASVFEATVADFRRLGLNYAILPILSDVDVEADLGDWAAPFLV